MKFAHAMTFRRKLALLTLTLFSSLLLAAPLTSAGISLSSDGGTSSSDLSDQCGDVSDGIGGALGCESTDKIIDFTTYQGQLEGPDASGYDDALTQTTDARDFIQTVVNFALSFLGIVAVVIVIYGGVLYVLSRGDEEMVSKGKKTMGYAMMGILLILGSFALVNTLIGATGGGNDSTLGGSGAGTTISESGAAFDTDAVLNEIEDIVQDYIDNYDTYQTVSSEVSGMLSLEVPYTIELETDNNSLSGYVDYVNEWLSGQDSDPTDTVVIEDAEHLRNFTDGIQDSINDIQNAVDPFSATYESAQALYDYLRSGDGADFINGNTAYKEPESTLVAQILDWVVPIAYAADVDIPGFLEALSQQGINAGTCADGLDATTGEYTSPVSGSGGNISGSSGGGLSGSVDYSGDIDIVSGTSPTCEGVYDIYESAVNDYLDTLRTPTSSSGEYVYYGLLERAEDLQKLFETDSASGSSSLQQLNNAADALYTLINAEVTALEGKSNPIDQGNLISSSRLRSVVQTADEFYQLVQNIQFVDVTLTASATRGNAPLIVNFDALGTEDPTGDTVTDDRISWDFGDVDSGSENTAEGASATHTFEEPGTYRVRLKATSSSSEVAAGLAVVTILVEPPKSQIVLTAKTANTSEPYTIADFTAFPAIDRDTYKVTMAEAQEGITFDASETLDGDGNDGASGGIIQYEWDYGDNIIESGGYTYATPDPHAYGEEGSYEVSLTVTDSTGEQDRKVFTLYVASPAARISCSPNTVGVGDSIKCDGTQSSADIGTIVSYDWTVTDSNNDTIDLETDSGSSINMSLDDPGIYTVTLVVRDSTGVSDSSSTQVVVESQEPVALFDVSAPDNQNPALRVFDATDSYDPDEADVVSYTWDFDGEEGTDYEIVEGAHDEAEVSVEFLKAGDYDVVLKVSDQHEAELQKSDTATETVAISSLLDVDMEVNGDTARFLDENGEVEVEFTAYSDHATFFEIDFDDGETDATQNISRGEATFTHTYTTAGVFDVTLTAEDDDGNSNSVGARVYISPGDAPIAVIDVTSEGEDIGDSGDLHGNVNTVFRFDATDSVNIDGTTSGLSYSWNFGDGTTSSQSSVTHSFEEIATYTVTLTVRDKTDSTLENQSTVSIKIEGLSPTVKSMSLTPQGGSLETPVQVNVSIEAEDKDGTLNFYKGWYYALDDSATELGTVVSQSSNFTITVNTNGEEGEEKEYGFSVEVTDNDNNTTVLDEAKQPTLTVVNGPNDNPVASFSVDRTSIFLGETLVINDTSYDPDGDIETIWVDLEGNGFYDNDPIEGTTLEWTPTQVYPDGVEIQVKVKDNSGATDTSEKLRVYVDAVTDPPEAAFLTNIDGKSVTFSNNSKLDDGISLQGVYWDINLSDDSDGDGDPANDIDYLEESFTHTYDSLGTYQVKFTVVDETGQSDSVTLDVNVIDAKDPEADFTYSITEEGGTEVDFRNSSTVDEDNDLTVRSYSWDFDLDVDSDGDDDPENDEDSTGRSPNYDYGDYGSYQVKLTVVDSIGQEDSVIQEVIVPNPIEPVEAVLTSVPQPNSSNQVILDGSEGDITFYFSANGGSEKYQYEIDKNIFYDSDSDGIRENDVDYDTTKSGSWKTTFYDSYGQIVVKLTVTDLETGETDVDTIQVVFQGSLGAANLFNATPSEMLFLILSALLAAIFGTTIVFRNQVKVRHSSLNN